MSVEKMFVIGNLIALLVIVMFGFVICICQCSNTKDDFEPNEWGDDDGKKTE